MCVDARASTRGDIVRSPDSAKAIFPRYARRAKGSIVWDVDGNEYIDYLLGYGAIVLGHADDRVNRAVVRELELGSCFSPLWSERQVELAELLVSVVPGAERAYVLKTGSDATSAAVRLARIYTGRNGVVRWGYNGWHDWSSPSAAGIPAAVRELTFLFEYNDLDSLRSAFKRARGDIACIAMMPFELEPPKPGFLEGVKEIADENGALLVLDEMRSGFRLALGGAQEYWQVRADVAAFSKAMSNGYAISAIVGRADVLDCLSLTKISSTFYASAPEMAAALTTISILRDTDAIARIWELGERLQTGLREAIEESQIRATVLGLPPCPFLDFGVEDPARRASLETSFYSEVARQGILLHPSHHWYVSAAHTENQIDWTIDVCKDAFERLKARHVVRA
jgi:glutamate-1-semialdehyde aminotransferase